MHENGWWKRFTILLRGLERRNSKESALAGLQYAAGLLANSTLTEKSFDKTQEHARDLLYSVMGQLYPWEGASYEERINKEASDYKKQWMEVTGEDPDSPEYKAKEARLLDYLSRPRPETEAQKREKVAREAHLERLREKKDLVKKRRDRNRRSVWTRR